MHHLESALIAGASGAYAEGQSATWTGRCESDLQILPEPWCVPALRYCDETPSHCWFGLSAEIAVFVGARVGRCGERVVMCQHGGQSE